MNISHLVGSINNEELYRQAFIHKSAVDESNNIESNERLEFIGDSVLNLVIAQYLYEKYPQEHEGFLTRIRTKMVSGKALSSIAKKLKFDDFIVMNEKGMKNEWNKNPRLLEDALEAIIGAIFLDTDIEKCKEFINKHIIESFEEEYLLEDNNYKDILMRYVQGRKLPLPEYKLAEETPQKIFRIQVYISGKIVSEGCHRVKKQAEQNAAKRTLQCFNIV